MFQRLWAAVAVLAVVATPLGSQNPPAPPPTQNRDTTKATPGQLPRPQQPPPKNVSVTTGMQSPSSAGGITLDSTLLAVFRWRNIGPANMGGRVSSVTGIPSPSKTFFVAAAGGGIWKTTNNGTSFRPVFDNEKCVAMGEVAI